jgi:glycosyltransferase involved in cell wall biosynthesis
MMNKALMLIPVYKRPEIVRDCYASIGELPINRLWIVSNEDMHLKENVETVSQSDRDYVINYSNRALGAKMNAGILYAVQEIDGWEYLMGWGSDMLLDPTLIDLYTQLDGEMYFGINNTHIFNTHTGEVVLLQNYNGSAPVGGGRMIHRDLIECTLQDRTLYNDEAMSGLDGNLHSRLKEEATVIDTGIHPYAVDLKTAQNINPFQFFQDMPRCDRSVVDDIHGKITLKYG